MSYVFLWTDVLIYVLLMVVAFYIWRARTKPHLAAPWRKVARRPAAMAASVVLLAFVLIGVLDSIHFRPALPEQKHGVQDYSLEVISVLDKVLQPLREGVEKTYSAPFTTHLFTMETMETMESADGKVTRAYPKLRVAGTQPGQLAHLIFYASATALLITGVLFGIVVASLGKRHGGFPWRAVLVGKTDWPWRAILLTLGGLIYLVCLGLFITPYYHVLGTDKVGQDVLYLTLKSIRTGLAIGTLTTLVMLPFALWLGVMAGYFKGWVDDVIQYLYTTLNSIPSVLLIAAGVLMMQVYMDIHAADFNSITQRADFRLLFLCFILGVTSWTGLCRLLRGETLKLAELEYVQAAQAFGVGPWKILSRHVLPNVMHIVLITITLDFSALVLAEAVLAYVGVGVDPTMNSWGNMINSARMELAREPVVWWPLAAAFVFMFGLVLAANLFADAVRDAFDPRSA